MISKAYGIFCVAVTVAWFAAALVFAFSFFCFGDRISGVAALFCLVCAFWNGWRWRLWRQLYDESRLLGRWWLADLPSVLFAAAFAVLLCVMGAWRIFGEGWPIFDGRLS